MRTTEKATPFFDRISFSTPVMLKGWGEDNRPIWGKLIDYDADGWPRWEDWDFTRSRYVEPLCRLASTVALFGNEWIGDGREIMELRKFVGDHFKKQGRHFVCDKPAELIDFPLFWTGGGGRYFILFQVLSFNIEQIGVVLDYLRHHTQACKMSPRYGSPFTSMNSYAKSIVKEGGFAALFTGGEIELYYPMDYRDQVEKVADEVEQRRQSEMRTVRARAHSA